VSASSRTALGDIELQPVCRRYQVLIVPLRCLWHRPRRGCDHHRRLAPIWPGSPPRGTVLAKFAPV